MFSFFKNKSRQTNKRPLQRRSFRLERLEDRHLMAFVPVAPPIDSLQQAPAEQFDPPAGDIHVVTELPLHSLPSARTKLFLDFNGHYQEQRFGDIAGFGGWDNVLTPAYDRDSDPIFFSPREQDDIRFIWASVAEDFAPFNIDVTTVDPDPGRYHPELPYMRIVISGESDFTGNGLAGISEANLGYYGAYANGDDPNVSYVFERNGDGSMNSVEFLALAVSHEAGHAFGLNHYPQSLVNDTRGPIMAPNGSGTLHAERQTWFQMRSSNFAQDDMATIANSSNGFGYRTDDHPSSFSAAAQLIPATVFGPNNQPSGALIGHGVIEKTTDVDTFKFTTGGGNVSVHVNLPQGFDPAHPLAMVNLGNLDASLRLYNAQGKLIAQDSDPTLLANLSANVPAGTYYVQVGSYGIYGDVGQYSLMVEEHSGPKIVSSQYKSISSTQATLEVTFNEPIMLSSFTTADIRVNGGALGAGVFNVNPVTSDAKRFLITVNKPVSSANAALRWSITVGPDITDLFSNRMDQNQNGLLGEPGDAYQFSVQANNTVATNPKSTKKPPTKIKSSSSSSLSPAAVDAFFRSYS